MKYILLFAVFNLFNINFCIGQSLDSLYQFAKTNEDLFWNLVSNNYPFTRAEIETHKDDINFKILSENENIDWDADLILKYESRLAKTYSLAKNLGVNWDEGLIEVFRERSWFDWSQIYFKRKITISKDLYNREKQNFLNDKFIIGESTDSLSFYYDFKHPKEYDKFEKYLKRWYSEKDSTRVNNYNELKKYFGRPIETIPIDTLIRYAKEFDWFFISQFTDLQWSWKTFSKLYPHLDKNYIFKNKSIYSKLIEPYRNPNELCNLAFEQKKRTRYHRLTRGEDEFGNPPEIRLKGSSEYYITRAFNFTDSLPDSLPKFSYHIDHTHEGPKRFLDVIFFRHGYRFPGFACSAKLQNLLSSYNLPNHKFYPIKVHLDSQWYGKDTANYFLFVTTNSDLLQNLELDSIRFINTNSLFPEPHYLNESNDTLKINSIAQFKKYLDPAYHYQNYRTKTIQQLKLSRHFDLTTISGKNIFISDRLKKSLTDHFISGISFTQDRTISWKYESLKPVELDSIEPQLEVNNINKYQKTILAFKEARKHQIEISKSTDDVRHYYNSIDYNPTDSLEKKLMKKEMDFNVIIPMEYRKYLLSQSSPRLGSDFNEYDFLTIDRVELVQKVWYKNIPQTFRGILIAENGLGDFLGLLLEPGSNYVLSNIVYKFEHELGKIIKSVEIK